MSRDDPQQAARDAVDEGEVFSVRRMARAANGLNLLIAVGLAATGYLWLAAAVAGLGGLVSSMRAAADCFHAPGADPAAVVDEYGGGPLARGFVAGAATALAILVPAPPLVLLSVAVAAGAGTAAVLVAGIPMLASALGARLAA